MRGKKVLNLTLTVLVVITMLSSGIVSASSPSSWALAEVNEARGKGLILPEADGDYQEDITRELFCKLIVNLVELVTDSPVTITIANPFTDTSNTDVIKAYQLGIVNGTSTTTFSPNDLINREQIAAMMMRAARELDSLMGHHFTMIQLVGDPTFADTDEISSWALYDIRVANAIGVMNGVGGNRIDPKGTTTIEQSILLILRVFNDYLPLMENLAPLALPTGVFEYNVTEGTSVSFDLSDIVYDPEGDSINITGIGGNTTYGTLDYLGDTLTFTGELVDANADSLWSIDVSDGTESTTIEFIFHVMDINEAPYGLMILPFTVNEGETMTIIAEDFARDPNGDELLISNLVLNTSTPTAYGSATLESSPNSIVFVADEIDSDKQVKYDVTITDGTNSTQLTLSINIINVNKPPVGVPMTLDNIYYQNESTSKIYWGFDVATDPDGDTLNVTDFAISDGNIHDVGTGSIRDFDGAYYFYFEAGAVSSATWMYFDLTVSDGIDEVIVPIRIQVNNN